MARKRKVTRTIKTTEVFALLINKNDLEPYNETIVIPTVFKDDKKLEKAVKESLTDENVKLIDIVNVNIVTKLYGMDEDKFIAEAEILPDRIANSDDENSDENAD